MDNYIEMINYLNTHAINDSYSRIVLYLLDHKETIKGQTIDDLASKCYVSNATISRFSRFFGFGSFADLKKSISSPQKINPEYTFRISHKSAKELVENPGDFFTNYKNFIFKSLDDVADNFDVKETDELLMTIHESQPVYLFGSTSSLNLLREIQLGLFVSGKLVFSGETTDDLIRLAENLNEQATVVIISSFGNFLSEYPAIINAIKNSQCKTIFITQHTENMMSSSFDHAIQVTSRNHIEAGSYPLHFYCDYLVRRYNALFVKNN